MTKPTLVLVHGAYHSPVHFQPLKTDLESHGYKCAAVALPSTWSPDAPPATFADDTAAVRTMVTLELDAGNDVVLVAHSWGGCPANNALQGLFSSARSASGHSTSVLAIAFISAIPQPTGIITAKLMPPDSGIHDRRNSEHFCWVKQDPGPNFYFYNDLPAEEAKRWSGLLRPMSWVALEGQTSYAAYMDIPCTYLICEKDNTMPVPVQEWMVKAAVDAGARIETERVDAGHSPFLSRVEETSGFVRRVAQRLMV